MTDTYCYLQLKGEGRDRAALSSALAEVAGTWRSGGVVVLAPAQGGDGA